jgi:hypothetical protein
MIQLAALIYFALVGDPLTEPAVRAAKAPTATDQKLAEKWLAERLKTLNTLPGIIKQLETGPLAGGKSTPSLIARMKIRIADAKAGSMPPPFLDFPLAIGGIGALRGHCFRMLQRLGNAEARVGIHRPLDSDELDRALRSHSRRLPEVDVFLTGFDVSAMADDQEYKTEDRCFIVTKTKTYSTSLGGPRTIFVIEPYETTAAEAIFRKAVKEELDGAREIEARKKADAERGEAEVRAASERREADKSATKVRRREEMDADRLDKKHQADVRKYPALLKNARSLISHKLYAPAEKMLRRIIDEAPGTETAKEAQKELDALPAH